jgi:hypothetical protein
VTTTPEESLRVRLASVPPGRGGWSQFEEVACEVLTYLFVPPLERPRRQARTYSGIDRRDAVFPNRNRGNGNSWGQLQEEVGARLVLVEFKNYDGQEIGKDEVNQTRNYLTEPMGRLALIVSTKKPSSAAYVKRNSIWSEDRKVILFITVDNLREMLFMKERGEDPSDLVVDLLEDFYLSWE